MGGSPDAIATQPWDAEHPVLEIIRKRRASGSRPGARDHGDTAKVGLAVEGGGMRGVVSASMLAALEDQGFSDAFDAVYGCSSGAVNSAYFLAGGTWYPVSIYYDDLTSRRFIDFARGLRGGNVLDLDYAFGEVVEIIKPLAYDRVLAADTPLHVAITDVDAIRTRLISDFTDRTDLKAALLASAWLPIAVRGTAQFRGWRALDGGVVTALPFRLALRDGCTHVLSLSTRPMRSGNGGLGLQHRYTHRYLEKIKKGLGTAYLASVRQRLRDQVDLTARRDVASRLAPYVLDLAPLPEDTEVKRHELRSHLLISAARRAYSLMYCAVEGRPADLLRSGRLHAVPRLMVVDQR
ncbi:patatin-like phospholipase family protein [Solwaraspora sp. WMMB762]|uniref:patatin-like phospholipase family protein n=1 Tax=Solwaraspora sp. WMMB762 TaxID=3404120 RepID=UPI003B95770B